MSKDEAKFVDSDQKLYRCVFFSVEHQNMHEKPKYAQNMQKYANAYNF